MQDNPTDTRSHYDRFLAEQYVWMAGGFNGNTRKNRIFFAGHDLVPQGSRVAIDLGAGCGFQSVPLADAGFQVVAVDFCRPLLLELQVRAGNRPIDTIEADILNFPAWASRHPELIVCMGDTLTHLPDMDAVRLLIRQCHAELADGGELILSLRDYCTEPEGSVVVIPVRRDPDRIFLCRLEYGSDTVGVTDILISRESEGWMRTASSYTKIRIAREDLVRMLADAGFGIEHSESGNGVMTVIARKTG